ncbi:MAG: hypothetical protein ACTSPB_00400 [Candidatus Thorarchaeota archaeon]
MELIGIIAWGVLFFLIAVVILQHYQEKKERARIEAKKKRIMEGKPTFKGKLENVEYSAGGLGSENITIITLGSRVIRMNGYVEPLVIGKRYKFWVTRSMYVLKFEEDGE